MLSKIRASCEGVLLAAQDEISRDMTLRFTQLESTLNRTLTEAVRPIEQRVVSALNHSGFHARIRLAPLHRAIFNFNIRPFFVEAIAEEAPPDRRGRMRETFSRWLNQPDWSGNEYLKEKRRYTTEITRLHQHTADYVQLFCQQISKALTAHIDVSVTAQWQLSLVISRANWLKFSKTCAKARLYVSTMNQHSMCYENS